MEAMAKRQEDTESKFQQLMELILEEKKKRHSSVAERE